MRWRWLDLSFFSRGTVLREGYAIKATKHQEARHDLNASATVRYVPGHMYARYGVDQRALLGPLRQCLVSKIRATPFNHDVLNSTESVCNPPTVNKHIGLASPCRWSPKSRAIRRSLEL